MSQETKTFIVEEAKKLGLELSIILQYIRDQGGECQIDRVIQELNFMMPNVLLKNIDRAREMGLVKINYENNNVAIPDFKPVERGCAKRGCTKNEPSFEEIDLPYNDEEYRAAWREFCEHRRQIKKKLTPLAVKKLIKILSELSREDGMRAIDMSIASRWQGIFPPKSNHTLTTRKLNKANGGECW